MRITLCIHNRFLMLHFVVNSKPTKNGIYSEIFNIVFENAPNSYLLECKILNMIFIAYKVETLAV
jgi:hypothetical protein